MKIAKVISGGQTGVDRAALDAALELGIPIGGYCPAKRQAEDGVIPARYPLEEMGGGYPARTRKNVAVSYATLIVVEHSKQITGGTRLAEITVFDMAKPSFVVCIVEGPDAVRRWLSKQPDGIVLNCAGPRESKALGIYEKAKAFFLEVFKP